MLAAAYENGQQAIPPIKQEAQQAKTQAADDIEKVKEHVEPTPSTRLAEQTRR